MVVRSYLVRRLMETWEMSNQILYTPKHTFLTSLLRVLFAMMCFLLQTIVKSVQSHGNATNGGGSNDEPGWIEVLWPR